MKRICWIRIVCLCVLGLFVFCHQATCQTVRYVDAVNGDDYNNGTSWGTAKQTIQSALNVSASGDEIHVLGYDDDTEYNECITLRNGVSIRGGYTGSGENRDVVNRITVISGDGLNDSVVTASSGITRSTLLEWLTIKNGAGKAVGNYRYGGGIYCSGASPTISHCTVCNNTARYGGGIYADINSSPDIEDSTIDVNTTTGSSCGGGGIYWYGGICRNNDITNNSSYYPMIPANGGGVYFGSYAGTGTIFTDNKVSTNSVTGGGGGGVYMSNVSSSLTFSGNHILNNTSTPGGGGGIIVNGGACDIVNNDIIDNTGSMGGGICASANNSFIISGNTITDNDSGSQGGGLWLQCAARVRGNIITDNTATGNGGGVYYWPYTMPLGEISCNTISRNTATGWGGGIHWIHSSFPGSVFCNVMKDNSAGINGNGVYVGILGANSVFANNTIINSTSGNGSGVYLYNSNGGYLRGNIIVGNSQYSQYGIYQNGGTYYRSKNCLYGNTAGNYYPPGQPLGSDILADPLLTDDHLAANSPCIDAGDDSVVQSGWLDIDGDERILYDTVDIGADEYDAPTVADDGDYTCLDDQLHASWSSPCPGTMIAEYEYAIGTSQGGTDVADWDSVGTRTDVTRTDLSLGSGPYYFSVRAKYTSDRYSANGYSDGITVSASAHVVDMVSDNRDANGEIKQYEKYEAVFSINPNWIGTAMTNYNPFSPKLAAYDDQSEYAWKALDGIYVDAVITKPDQTQIRWPCFYDYSNGWKLRFAPTATGIWSYRIDVRYGNGTPEVVNGPERSFVCISNPDGWSERGFLRVDSDDYRFFSFSGASFASAADDIVFYPYGVKCWSTADIDSLAAGGGTYSRLFSSSYMFEHIYSTGDRINNFQEEDAVGWDEFIERAREEGVHLLYLVNDWTYWNSADNPYGVEEVAQSLADTFATDSEAQQRYAREVFKRKLRWMMARWGYSTSIMGFDLINECQMGAAAQDFHNDMGAYIRGDDSAVPASWPIATNYLDEQPHLVTGDLSSDHYGHTEAVDWTDDCIGMGNLHSYVRTNYSGGSPFYGDMDSDDPPDGLEGLGTELTYLWQDTAAWADRAVRMHRRSGFAKPFSWTEFGCGTPDLSDDWTAAYQGDTTAQHAKDWLWGLLLTGGSGSHWLPGYFNGDFNGGTAHWTIFEPLNNYFSGTDFRGMTQESAYRNSDETNADSILNPNPHVISSNHLVGVYCMRGSDKAYVYAKNLTNTWYYNAGFRNLSVPTPASQSANIIIKGLQASTTYTIDRWSTTDPNNQVKGTITRTTNGSGDIVFPVNWDGSGNAVNIGATTDYDWGYKIYR